jgi:hypothetical protein
MNDRQEKIECLRCSVEMDSFEDYCEQCLEEMWDLRDAESVDWEGYDE